MTLFVILAHGPRCHASLSIKNVAILLKNQIDQSALANARRPNENQRLVLLWRWVERVEVLLGIDENVILTGTQQVDDKYWDIWHEYGQCYGYGGGEQAICSQSAE